MSDGAVIFAYSGYFLDCRPIRLTEAREAKVTMGDLTADFIRDISARRISV